MINVLFSKHVSTMGLQASNSGLPVFDTRSRKWMKKSPCGWPWDPALNGKFGHKTTTFSQRNVWKKNYKTTNMSKKQLSKHQMMPFFAILSLMIFGPERWTIWRSRWESAVSAFLKPPFFVVHQKLPKQKTWPNNNMENIMKQKDNGLLELWTSCRWIGRQHCHGPVTAQRCLYLRWGFRSWTTRGSLWGEELTSCNTATGDIYMRYVYVRHYILYIICIDHVLFLKTTFSHRLSSPREIHFHLFGDDSFSDPSLEWIAGVSWPCPIHSGWSQCHNLCVRPTFLGMKMNSEELAA